MHIAYCVQNREESGRRRKKRESTSKLKMPNARRDGRQSGPGELSAVYFQKAMQE
jgi:hypothetical protein